MQLGKALERFLLQKHIKSRNPVLNMRRIREEASASDTWFATVTSYEGYNCLQFFNRIKSKHKSQYGMISERSGPEALLDFFCQEGAPISFQWDNSKMQVSHLWQQYMRWYNVKDEFTEPYHTNQNPAERGLASHKDRMERLMILTGCDKRAWFKLLEHCCVIKNRLTSEKLG